MNRKLIEQYEAETHVEIQGFLITRNKTFEQWLIEKLELLDSRNKAALEAVWCVDGAHHKQWVVDQMVRALTGEEYAAWVKAFEAGEDGPNTYEWEIGIAP